MTDPLKFKELSARTTLVTVTYGDRISFLQELLYRAFTVEAVAHAIVVSNASTSDLRALETKRGSRLSVIRLLQNTGSANGYATGIASALASNADFIWLMDDDNAPKDGALAALHHQLTLSTTERGMDKAAVLGFRPGHQADIANGINVRNAYPPQSSFFGFHYLQIPFKIWRRVKVRQARRAPASVVSLPYAPYGGLLAPSLLFKRIGLPKRELILYADDTEYTSRIVADGGVIELVTQAELEDLEGSWNLKEKHPNAFSGWLQGGSDFRAFYAARNQAWFDRNVWKKSNLEYEINHFLFVIILKLHENKSGRHARYRLLSKAIKAGRNSKLGIAEEFPL